MPLRPLFVSVLIFILVMTGISMIRQKLPGQHVYYNMTPNLSWIGVIDRNYAHDIDVEDVFKGQDILLVVDYTNPRFQRSTLRQLHTLPAENTLEIGEFDTNHDGIIDEEDPIYPYLYVVAFDPSGEGYRILPLLEAGVRGIRINPNKQHREHIVVMADGSTAILYEVHKPEGLSIYSTEYKTVTRPLTK
jgi:hypothetical protein